MRLLIINNGKNRLLAIQRLNRAFRSKIILSNNERVPILHVPFGLNDDIHFLVNSVFMSNPARGKKVAL